MSLRRRRIARAISSSIAAAIFMLALDDAAITPATADIQNRIDAASAREQALQGVVAGYAATIGGLNSQVAAVESRLAVIQADVDAKRAELARLQDQLEAARARLAFLQAELVKANRLLAQHLVAGYESGPADVVTVILQSKGFADLLERAEFLRRVKRQDVEITTAVRIARKRVIREAA